MTKLPGRVSGFSPLPCPGTLAASLQRRLPCRDELLTGPKTACLMLCQARHGAAGMLAASWPTPCITGPNPFYPLSPSLSLPFSLSLSLSLRPFFLVPRNCYAKLSTQRCGSSFKHRCIQSIFVQSPVIARDAGLIWELLLARLSSQVQGWRLTWDHVPHLWKTETHYPESGNIHFRPLSQIPADSCWTFSFPQR